MREVAALSKSAPIHAASLELQRPMLRATNTGATAIIDHQGRVTAQLPPFTRGALQGQVHGRRGNTVYADWASRWGLWPLVGLACLVVLLALGLRVAAKAAAEEAAEEKDAP